MSGMGLTKRDVTSKVKLVVGCPISHRAWILPKWKEHLDGALGGIDVELVFALSPDDTESLDIVNSWDETSRVVFTDETPRKDVRDWDQLHRYHQMVDVRNTLLAEVRDMNPDLFLSLDSDMLLHPDAITSMLSVFDERDAIAVGGKAFMSVRGQHYPSYGSDFRLRRGPCDTVRKAAVLMGIILMTKRAYSVDYIFDPKGEDIGWAKSVDGQLWWDGRITNKHVMRKIDISVVDPRVGF